MTGDELTRCDQNYFDSMRLLAPALDGGEVRERGGLLIAASAIPVPMLNIAFITRPLVDPDAQLREAIAYFEGRKLPFLVRVREKVDPAGERAAKSLGLNHRDDVPGMALSPLPDTVADAPLDIRTVVDQAELEQYVRTLAGGFGMPVELAAAFASPHMLEAPDMVFYAGYVDGAVVATSALVMTRRVAGVYNVATLPDFRKRGLGEAMTWHAVREGAGGGCLLSSLQASQMGRPIYERMGFRTVAQYKTYILPKFVS